MNLRSGEQGPDLTPDTVRLTSPPPYLDIVRNTAIESLFLKGLQRGEDTSLRFGVPICKVWLTQSNPSSARARGQTQQRGKSSPEGTVPRTIRRPRRPGDPSPSGSSLRVRPPREVNSGLGANPPIGLRGHPEPATSVSFLLPDLLKIPVRGAQTHLGVATPVTWPPPYPIGARAAPRTRNLAGRRRRPGGGSEGCCGSQGCARSCCYRGSGGGAEAVAALPTLGRSASQLAFQPRLSPPGPAPASACPMSVSLVVIRLELAEHSSVPSGFGFSAAGESRGLAALRLAPRLGPGGSPSQSTRPGKGGGEGLCVRKKLRGG